MKWCIPLLAVFAMAAAPVTPPDNSDPASLVGKEAPAFQLGGLDGKQHGLGDYKGSVVVLDFWGTFCVPCKKSMPRLDALEKELGDKGLTILAINEGGTNDDARKFVSGINVTLPVLMDPDSAAGNAYLVDALPETVIVGRDGHIVNVFNKGDEDTDKAIEAAIRQKVGRNPAATQPAALKPDEASRALLAKVGDAYQQIKSLVVSGTIDGEADISGEKISRHAEFSGAFDGPTRFRHEVTGDTIVAAADDKVYVYLPAESLYVSGDGSKARCKIDDLPAGAAPLLRMQDLSMALALSDDAGRDLIAGATGVERTDDQKVDALACPALKITYADCQMVVAFDPSTYMVRRVGIDSSSGLTARGAEVKKAMTTVDFAKTAINQQPTDEQLAFVLPPTASEDAPEASDPDSLAGKPAPAFKLKGLDGMTVSSNDLKGTVYILDFWATWCGPCRASLPGLDNIYKSKKADGLKVFACNQMEDAETVKKFVADTGLSIPVLLDSDRSVGAAYGAEGIPETVVIGRDGLVKDVFVGSGHEEDIASAVDGLLGENAKSAN